LRVSGRTAKDPVITFETVLVDTPASSATSRIVTRDPVGMCQAYDSDSRALSATGCPTSCMWMARFGAPGARTTANPFSKDADV
jgi:hypothetical protein